MAGLTEVARGAFMQALGALDAPPRAKLFDADFEGMHERNLLLLGRDALWKYATWRPGR
jgi:hypothetical protein